MFAAVASAHVSVLPKESTTGAWETYTMKVPVEKDVNTNKVVLKMPKGVEFQQYEPIPGWKTTVDEAAGTVTWEAQGDGIAAGQFQRFTFVAKNPEQPGEAAWDAFQYYTDGSIVEWTGDENADTPHSITTIGAEASGTAANSHGQAVASNPSSDPAAAQTEEDQAAESQTGVSDPASAATEENEQADSTSAADTSDNAASVSEPTTAAADAPSDTQASSGQSVLLYVTLALSIVAIGLSGFALATRKRK